MNNITGVLVLLLIAGIIALCGSFYDNGKDKAYAIIEYKCMYEHRVEFSGQLYSCQWLEGVTIDNQQYERKPHPLKEGLMK